MKMLDEVILGFYNMGYSVRKLSNSKFTISKKLVNHGAKEIIIEYDKDNQLDDDIFIMYAPFAKKFDKWEFDLKYEYYDFDYHYKKRCEYDLKATLLVANIFIHKPNMKLYINHRKKITHSGFVIHMAEMRDIYNLATSNIFGLINRYSKDPESFLRDPSIPKSLKYISIKCKGSVEEFMYGSGWVGNAYYTHRLVMDVLDYMYKNEMVGRDVKI